MSQPVKLSDALVLDARMVGQAVERSIAGQVEFWAKLGRGVESLLDGAQVLSLCRTGGAKPLSELAAAVNTPTGRERLHSYLESQSFPHYESLPGRSGLLVRIEADGSRNLGRFVNRVFVKEQGKTVAGKKERRIKEEEKRHREPEGEASEARRLNSRRQLETHKPTIQMPKQPAPDKRDRK